MTENATLDGAIEMTTDWFGPEDNEAQDMLAANREQREAADALLVGRQTSQDLRGFVDEVRLLVYPVVVGAGQRLSEGLDLGRLELVQAQPFDNGVVLMTHRVRNA